MSTYGWILIGTVLFPALFSFEKRVAYYRRWAPAIGAAFLVAVPFLAWDLLAAFHGDWRFAREHTAGLFWWGLPLEEYLFFLAVPFSCTFLHAALQRSDPARVRERRWPWFAAGAAALVLAAAAWPRTYSFIVLLFLGTFLLLAPAVWKTTFFTRAFWWAQLVCVLPFLVVNGILTALPVVSYREEAIWGVRILTIPVEDLVYSFVLVGANLCVSESFRQRLSRDGS